MRILAIETSCDETAIALVGANGGLKQPKFKILKNLVASQIKIHRPYGGVVPGLAKREHLKNLPILLKKIQNTKYKIQDTNLIAVTVGPGLEPCLWTGINFAKDLYKKFKIENRPSGDSPKVKLKIIGTSHTEGHIYSFLLRQKNALEFPVVALVVSGGHTALLLMKNLIHYKKLGETRDDAVGECFDKVARLLNLPYPGGPEIEKIAKKGNPVAINFPRPMLNQKNYDFSFSGLKTAVLYYLKDSEANIFSRNPRRRAGMVPERSEGERAEEQASEHAGRAKRVEGKDLASDVAASFQAAAFDVLISKTLKAVKEFSAKSIILSGGVASNISIRKYLKLKVKGEKLKVNLFIPDKKFCTDNAAMIAVAGYLQYLQNKKYALKAQGNLSI